MIPKQVIDELLSRADIKQVISPYVTLQRAGMLYKGLCPFHSEKSPSFIVYPQDNSFFCFGCGIGGNAITFIRKAENLEYSDACRFLGKQLGIDIQDDEDTTTSDNKIKISKTRYFEMNSDAARFFYNCLMSENKNSKEALSYLTDTRKLSISTIKHFGLGFAPGGTTLYNYLKQKGYSDDEMRLGNLITVTANGPRDAFYNRIMFPIISLSGDVIAFGGRIFGKQVDPSVPKYKNSSDTTVYNKRRNLYAMNFAKDNCKDSLILVEGYMDVITMHAAGFTNTIASLGTAITPEQVRLMKKYTSSIIISTDMDDAGRSAAEKAMRLFDEVDLPVKLLNLKDAKDPDEFIKKFGRDALQKALEESDTKFEYKLQRILSKYRLDDPQDKISAIKDSLYMISDFYSEAEKSVYLQEISKKLGVDLQSLKNDLNRIIRQKMYSQKKQESQNIIASTNGVNDHVNLDFIKMPAVAKAEENVLGILILKKEEFHDRIIKGKIELNKDSFITEFNTRVFESYINSVDGSINEELFTPDELGRITRMKVNRMQVDNNSEKVLLECIEVLKEACESNKSKDAEMTPLDLVKLIQSKKER